MRKRGGNFLRKAMAVLLSAILCVGMIVGTGPAETWAAEGTQTVYLVVEFDGCTEVPAVNIKVYLRDDDNNVYNPSVNGKTGSLTYKVEELVRNKQYYWIIDGTTIPFKSDSLEYTVARTLYAVKFMDGSKIFDTQYVAYGGKAKQPSSNPTKAGYTFAGWETVYGTEFSLDTSVINKSTTIYAAWKRIVTNDALGEQIRSALSQITITNSTKEADIKDYVKTYIKQVLDIEPTVTVDIGNWTQANNKTEGLIKLKVSAAYGQYSATEEESISTPREGTDWTLDSSGYLTISSQAGMDDWAQNEGRTNNLSNVRYVRIGNNVTKIPDNAFKDCNKLSSVSIPYTTITSIGNAAFADASSLSGITLPPSVKSMGDDAFSGCSSLKRVTMRGSTPPEFGNLVFDGCKFVTNPSDAEGIVVPSGSGETYKKAAGIYEIYVKEDTPVPQPKPQVTEAALGEKLQEILNELPVSNETTMDVAMRDVRKLLDEHFANTSTIQAGKIALTRANYEEDGLIVLEMTALCGGYSVTKQVTKSIPKLIPEEGKNWLLDKEGYLTILGQAGMDNWVQNGRTEENLPAVKEVLIQGGVAEIPDNAFNGCGNLEIVTIPNTVTGIGNSAFAGTSSLKEITLPTGIQNIGDGAFSGCSSLGKVVMQGTTPPVLGNAVFDGCKFVTDTIGSEGIVVPPGSENTYKDAGGVFGEYIKEEKQEITGEALKVKLQDVFDKLIITNDTTQETVRVALKKAVDEYFQIDCTITVAEFEMIGATIESEGSLKLAVTARYGENSAQAEGTILIAKLPPLPDRGWTLDEAGNLVIDGQAGMDDWTLNGRAEGKFPAVKNVLIQGDVTSIPDDAFSGCCDLGAIVIPDTVTSIGNLAFKHASSLSEITLPPNLQSIGDSAFADCSSLEKVVMQGATPPSIGASAFDECKFVIDSTKGIVVPNGSGDAYRAAWGAALGDSILEKHTHSFGTEWKYDAVNHWHECACGGRGNMASHVWGEGVVVTPPTATEAGSMGYICSECQAAKMEPISATGGDIPSVSGNDSPGGGDSEDNPPASGDDNLEGNPSVSDGDNSGDNPGDNPSVSGNDNQGGGGPGEDIPGSGGGTSTSENDNSTDGGIPQLPENSSELALFWNAFNANAVKDKEPKTADSVPAELYATVAMIAGFFYLLLLFLDKYDITEEARRKSLTRLVRWAKCGGWFRKLPVMAILLVMRAYYHMIDVKKTR